MVVNIYDAKTRLSTLIARVEQTGEEIVIRRHNVPVAKLVPFRPVLRSPSWIPSATAAAQSPSPFRSGRCCPPRRLSGWGEVVMSEDFDDLPDEVTDGFAGRLP